VRRVLSAAFFAAVPAMGLFFLWRQVSTDTLLDLLLLCGVGLAIIVVLVRLSDTTTPRHPKE
jgi:hypothetical protein